jgi:hypothetical protein
MAAALRNFTGRNADCFRVFMTETLYKRRGDVKGGPGPPHHMVARTRGRHSMVWLVPGPPPALLRTSSRVGKNRRFGLRFVQF